MSDSEEQNLPAAVHDLTEHVKMLLGELSIAKDEASRIERQARRTRWLARVVAVLVVACLAGVAVSLYLAAKVRETAETNKANQVTACENANFSRQANRALWAFVLDASAARPDQTEQQRELIADLRVWIGELYQDHDCSDLNRKYTIPPAPTLP